MRREVYLLNSDPAGRRQDHFNQHPSRRVKFELQVTVLAVHCCVPGRIQHSSSTAPRYGKGDVFVKVNVDGFELLDRPHSYHEPPSPIYLACLSTGLTPAPLGSEKISSQSLETWIFSQFPTVALSTASASPISRC